MNENFSNDTLKARTVFRQAPRRYMTEDKDLISYLILLRFGSYFDALKHIPILYYTSISQIVKKPVQTVRRLILLGLKFL
jgi:hypothetical protein